MNNETNKPVTIIEIISILIKHKSKILFSTIFVLIISIVVYFFILDLIFLSTATIKSSNRTSLSIAGLDNLDLGGLEGLSGGSKATKELALYEEILISRRCLEPLILKFNLMERDEYDFMEEAVKDFRKNRMIIEVNRLSGVLTIGVYDKDKQLAKEMIDFLLGELNTINVEMNVTNAKINREFIEKRYIQAKEDLTAAEDTLKNFQFIYGVAPDLQIKASAQTMFTMEAELKAEEVKLDVIKKILNADEPEVKTQEAKVNSLKNKISEINRSTDIDEILSLGNSPNVATNYLRLQRNVEIQQKILTFILPIYEQSKIEEKRDTPTIIVLEKPYISDKKVKPKRLTMVIVVTIVFSISFSFLLVIYELKIKNLIKILKTKS